MEIRIVLDAVEPPAGRVWLAGDGGQADCRCGMEGISFTGWLGLLRALYELTAEPGPAGILGAEARLAATERGWPGSQ